MTQSSPFPGRVYLLTYHYPEDWEVRKLPFREEHFKLVRQWHAAGRLAYAGLLDDPGTGALVVFDVATEEEVGEFVAADPYVTHGVVTEYEIRPWTVGSLS